MTAEESIRSAMAKATEARAKSFRNVFVNPAFAQLNDTTKEEIARFVSGEFARFLRGLEGQLMRETGGDTR